MYCDSGRKYDQSTTNDDGEILYRNREQYGGSQSRRSILRQIKFYTVVLTSCDVSGIIAPSCIQILSDKAEFEK